MWGERKGGKDGGRERVFKSVNFEMYLSLRYVCVCDHTCACVHVCVLCVSHRKSLDPLKLELEAVVNDPM